MNVCVLGLGYIGLPTAALLADAGHTVIGVDVNTAKRAELLKGSVPTTEPAVRELVQAALAEGKLQISPLPVEADAYVICVPTPTIEHKPNLHYVRQAVQSVAAVAPVGALIVLESTVPPGTTERIIVGALREALRNPDAFLIAHAPERVIPGATVRELRENDRVIGGRTPEASRAARALYAGFCRGEICETATHVAEFVKIVENTYRDINIAFANELAVLSEELGVDVWETIALANRHPRVNILSPGPGVGGHCIPVDPQFLSDANPLVTELIQSARRVNERMPYQVVRHVADILRSPAPGGKITLLGAAYKADVDDARESPCERIDELLRERGYVTSIYDPHVREFSRPLAGTLEEALRGSDAIVLVTGHREFAHLDPRAAAAVMRTRTVIDTRHFMDIQSWRACGFRCHVLGQGSLTNKTEAIA